uniref:GAG-pre-integrase domain-containing protein n=1 Tax=Arundo donax TaxID=35708 RepID=A0A0A8ZWY0_ARUDO
MSQLKKVFKNDLVVSLKDVVFEKDKLCSACQAGKQVANHHPFKNTMSTSRATSYGSLWSHYLQES